MERRKWRSSVRRSYEGLLEGLPTAEWNAKQLEGLVASAARVDADFVIEPDGQVQDVSARGAEGAR